MSKEKDDKTDLSSMSKEELITYLLSLEGQLQQQKEEAQKKEQANAQSTSAIVSNLRAELSRKESNLQSALKEKQQLSANIKLLSDEKQELEATVVKLKKFRQSVRDLLSNLLDSITNYYFVFKDMRSKDEVPEYDENNLLELNMFMDQKLDFLLSTAQTFLEHQKVALNLSRTEQTGHSSHVSEPQNCSADITAAADGESEYRNAVTVETDDHDLKDFDEAASSVTISSNLNSEVKTDSSASNNSNSVGNELTDVEVKEIVIKGCSQEHKDSVAQSLSAGTKVLSEHIRNDITSVSDSKRKRKFERFTSINDCNEVDGTITNSIGAHFHMYSNECGGTREFILKNKSKRINSVLTPSGSLGNLRTILSKVQIAVCSECKTETEVNPATLSDFTFTKSGKDEHHTLDEQRKNAKEKVEKAFNSVLSDVGTEEINESKTDDKRTIYQKENRLRQNERKAVFNSIENSDTADRVSFSLTDDLIEAGDGLTHIINPLSFDAQTFGMMPLFLKSVMSGTLLGSCGTLFTQLGAPKNRISCFYEGNGLPLTREQSIDQERENFWVYNNGITLLTNRFKVHENKITLSGMSIVNGAQTTGAIGSNKKLPENNALIHVRIIEVTNKRTDLIEKIIRYNNSQNQVEAADFRSTDKIQIKLKKEFDSIKYAKYEAGRRGSSTDKIKRKSAELGSYYVGQALTAFHGDPITAYNKKREIWSNNTLYNRAFNELTSAEHIIFCCTLIKAIENIQLEYKKKTSLTPKEEENLSFLRKRGAKYLFAYAVSYCIEKAFFKRTNIYTIYFNNVTSLNDALSNWYSVLKVLVPFCTNSLNQALSNGLKNTKEIDNGVKNFLDSVSAFFNVAPDDTIKNFISKIKC